MRRRDSLATNIMYLGIVLVLLAVTIVGSAALIGVFSLASDSAAARQIAYRQATSAELSARLDASTRIIDSVERIVTDPSSDTLNRTGIAEQYDTGLEHIDRLLLVRPDGTLVSAYPSFAAPHSVAGEEYFEGADTDVTTFRYLPSDGSLWVRRRVEGPDGPLVALARVRTSFLQVLLDSFSSIATRRVVYIADSDGTIIVSGGAGTTLDPPTAQYEPGVSDRMHGHVDVLSERGERMSGQFEVLGGYPGLRWYLAVVEPRMGLVISTWRALVPAVAAMLIGGALAIMLGVFMGRRLAAPLVELEKSAREVASGEFVREIESDRTDEIGRLADALNAMVLQINALHELSQLLASSSSLRQTLDGIIDAIRRIVGSAGVGIWLITRDTGELRLERAQGIGVREGSAIPVTHASWLTEALRAHGPTSFQGDFAELGLSLPEDFIDHEIKGIALPLVLAENSVGVIVITPLEHREFTQAEIEMLRTFSAQSAVAVHISTLFAEESDARRQAEVMREVVERLASPHDLDRSLAAVAASARDLLGVASTAAAFVDRSVLGLPPAADPIAERALLRTWEIAWGMGDGDSVTRLSIGEDAVLDGYLREHGASEILLLTIMQGGAPGAVIGFMVDRTDRTFTASERTLADAIGTEIGLALDNAFNFAQAQTRAANLETVFRISQAVSSSLQIKVVLNRVLDVVQKIFGADAVSLMEFDASRRLVYTVMARGQVSADMLHFECAPASDLPGVVFASGEPIRLGELGDVEGDFAAISYDEGLRSLLAAPLLARGRSLGVLVILSASPDAYSAEDQDLLHTFASQAALAIDTAALYGKEHHVASVLQASILPRILPQYDEVEASSVYLAAGDEAEIGGDYFDLFKTPDGQVFIAMGDVCGKGVVAATKTSAIKYSVRGMAVAGLAPGRILSEINNMVSESGDTSDIVTLWLASLDASACTLTHANGGHPPALLLPQDGGKMLRLETTGPLLGAIRDAEYGEVVSALDAGDTILMYTDGVTEARRGNKFFGEGRVRRALAKGGSPADVVDRLLASLDRFVPGSLRDDAAVLAVRIVGSEEGITAEGPRRVSAHKEHELHS